MTVVGPARAATAVASSRQDTDDVEVELWLEIPRGADARPACSARTDRPDMKVEGPDPMIDPPSSPSHGDNPNIALTRPQTVAGLP